MTTRYLRFLITAGLAGAVAGCASVMPAPSGGGGGDSGVLTGSVTYRERVALPPDAIVEVWIVDATPGMMIQAIVAQTTISTEGRQVPIRFELRYPRERVLPDHNYIVKAVIKSQREMLFASDDGLPVITHGHPSEVTLRLHHVGAAPTAGAGGLWGTAWRLEDLAGAGVLDRVQATLEFPETGKVAGNASCNRCFGSAQISGPTTIRFGALGTTRMACAEAVGNQEAKYLRALEGAEGFALQGDTLLVYSKGLDRPLRFFRKER